MKKIFFSLMAAVFVLTGCISVHAEELLDIEENTMVLCIDGEEHTLYLSNTKEEDYKERMDMTFIGYDEDSVYSYEFILRLPLGAEPGRYRCGESEAGRKYSIDRAVDHDDAVSNCNMELHANYSPLDEKWKKTFRAYEYEYRVYGEARYNRAAFGDYLVDMTYKSDDWMHYQGVLIVEFGNSEPLKVDYAYFDFTLGEQHEKTIEADEIEERLDGLIDSLGRGRESVPAPEEEPSVRENDFPEAAVGEDEVFPMELPWLEEEQPEEEYLVKCNWCGGSGKCDDCDGKGYTYETEYSINLDGGGGNSYEVKVTCALCQGQKECYKCGGEGYANW